MMPQVLLLGDMVTACAEASLCARYPQSIAPMRGLAFPSWVIENRSHDSGSEHAMFSYSQVAPSSWY
jgi:hypothetical protein